MRKKEKKDEVVAISLDVRCFVELNETKKKNKINFTARITTLMTSQSSIIFGRLTFLAAQTAAISRIVIIIVIIISIRRIIVFRIIVRIHFQVSLVA
jgi:hypothetical protein